MRVAQINTDAALASTGTIASQLMSMLCRDGNECRLFYGRGMTSDMKNCIQFANKFEVLLHGLQTRILGTHAQGSIMSTYRLLRILEDFRPDIIHLHNVHGYYVNFFILLNYIKEKDIPVIWTFHDAWPFTGHCAYFYDCEKWIAGCNNCPRKSDYPKSMFFDRSAGQWQKKRAAIKELRRMIIAAPSEWLAQAADKSFFGGRDIRVINNGIDTDNIFVPSDAKEARRAFGIAEEACVLAMVAGGFNDIRKGGHYLAGLVQRFKNNSVQFIVAGWQEKNTKLPVNIKALPVIRSPKEMARFYNSADAFLMLSEADNFPTVCIEALACGIPVIGFATGGVPEQIDENTGIVVAPGDMAALESAILKAVMGKSGTLSRKACRVRAEKLYSKQAMYDKYLKCYKDILSI